jgi:hypothetical protein
MTNTLWAVDFKIPAGSSTFLFFLGSIGRNKTYGNLAYQSLWLITAFQFDIIALWMFHLKQDLQW